MNPICLRLGACASVAAAVVVVLACSPIPAEVPLPPEAEGARRFHVSALMPWSPTGMAVRAGQRIEVWATGEVKVGEIGPFGWNGSITSTPRGTYRWRDEDVEGRFPLPVADAGPAPAFALIGRIGEHGSPFLVGDHYIARALEGGELFLGINDADLSENTGAYEAAVLLGGAPVDSTIPVDDRPIVERPADPRPVEDARVVLLFVDGLRQDVLREMAFGGYLPNFKRIFFDGGTDIERTFTIAPANTIPATTACLTGSWPDRTGLFEQAVFHRDEGKLDTLLDALGPTRSARKIQAEWWRTPFTTGTQRPRLITEWCESSDVEFASTVLPVLPDHPPDLYVQRLANVVPIFGAHELKRTYADRVQTSFALEQVIRKRNKVMTLWYTGVDVASHETARGLFGPARRELSYIDADLAKLEAKLKEEGIADRTYWMLFADHGMIGGQTSVSRNFDLANDFLYAPIRDDDGDQALDAGSGLGLNVSFQVHDISLERAHDDLAVADFAVFATQAYAAGWIALPKASFLSRDWSAPNTAGELASYAVHPAMQPVDVPGRLLAVTRPDDAEAAGIDEHPVALVAIPAPPGAVLLRASGGRAALIERRRRPDAGDWAFEFRYRPLASWTADADGIHGETSSDPAADPLGYLGHGPFRELLADDPQWLEGWRDDRTWLELTADSEYPDLVVAFSHLMLNNPDDRRLSDNERYDCFVVANRGWNFNSGRVKPAVHHGAPQYEGVHIPFMVAGPNVAKGARVTRPARIIDVLPTLLDIAGIEHKESDLDGRPVREIWGEPTGRDEPRPVEFALDQGLPLPPPDERVEHAALVHDPEEWYDLHNIATDVSTLLLQEIVNLIDGPADTFAPGEERKPLGSGLDAIAESYDELPEVKVRTRPGELVEALRLRHITIGELINPIQSLQHVDRAVGVVRWGQDVMKDPFRPLGPTSTVMFVPLDKTLDGASWIILAGRDVLERTLIRIVDSSVNGIEGGLRFCASAFASNGAEPAPRIAGGAQE